MRERAVLAVMALLGLLGAAPAKPPLPGAAVPWKPAGISSPQFESHAAFDPLNGDFYFVRSTPAFSGWRILVSRCGAKGWSDPRPRILSQHRCNGSV